MDPVTLDNLISDRGSRYAASGGAVRSRAEAKDFLKALKRQKKFARATHNSWAVMLPDSGLLKGDDGEAGAGLIIGRVLEGAGAQNLIIVVTRWYGGTHLGGDRFRHVTSASQAFLAHWAKTR